MSTKEKTIGYLADDGAVYDYLSQIYECERFAINAMQHEESRKIARALYRLETGFCILKPKLQKKVMADHEAVVAPILSALIKSVNKNTSGQFGRADLN